MAETIPGGAYLNAEKTAFHDCNGKAIVPPAEFYIRAGLPVPDVTPEPEPVSTDALQARITELEAQLAAQPEAPAEASSEAPEAPEAPKETPDGKAGKPGK